MKITVLVFVIVMTVALTGCSVVAPNVSKAKSEMAQLEEVKEQTRLMAEQNQIMAEQTHQLARIANALESITRR